MKGKNEPSVLFHTEFQADGYTQSVVRENRKFDQTLKFGGSCTISFSCWQELIRRWDSERELLRSAPGSYPNSLK